VRDGLAAEYLFTGDAADTSGEGRNGVVHGATLVADRFGNPDSAYGFDGVDDFIEITPPPLFSGEAMSISAWVRYDARDFDGWTNCFVAQDDGNDADQSRRVFQLSTFRGHIVWHRMIGARDPMCRRRVRPNVWYHVVGVHDHGVNRLYVDGVLHDEVRHPLWTSDAQPMHIGRKGTPESYFFFRGAIDDVRVYRRALDDTDVRELLHENGWTPSPGDLPVRGDPVSGQWGQHGIVFLDLSYDGNRSVTGRIMNGRPSDMATIESGTFDRETARLRLEGHAKDSETGKTVVWVIEGMLDDGEIAVRASISDFSGNFLFTRGGTRLRLTRRSLRSHVGTIAYGLRRAVGRWR
jgi:hypothetical protein